MKILFSFIFILIISTQVAAQGSSPDEGTFMADAIGASFLDSVANVSAIQWFSWERRYDSDDFNKGWIDSITRMVNLELLCIGGGNNVDTFFDINLVQSLPKLRSLWGGG